MSTSTTSSRPASLIASSVGSVSTSLLAASTRARYPVVMFCGMGVSFAADGGRAAAARSSWRLKRAARAGTMRRIGVCDAMAAFTLLDLLAFAWFVGAWLGYSLLIEKTAKGRSGLNAMMNLYRDEWMERLLAREMRMVDAQVTAALQNGTAFFASTSLIAIGGTLTLLRSTEQILTVVAALPFGVAQSQEMWELKMMGLAVIFVYAFFKFAWSYRLFNYFAIMVGAAPPPAEKDSAEAQSLRASRRAAMRRCRPPFQPRPARASSSRSVISAGFSARCRWRSPPPAS